MFRLDIATINEEPSSTPDTGSFVGSVFQGTKTIGRYRLTWYRRQRLAEVTIMFHESTRRADDDFTVDLHKKIDYEHFQEAPDAFHRLLIARVFSPSWQLPGSSRHGHQYVFAHVTTHL